MREPLLILRHEPFEHLGYFTQVLEGNQTPYQYHDLGEPMPQADFSGIIIMGGPMSANDDLLGLRAELTVIDGALSKDIPILGICLGSQLIAKALGAKVYPNAELEIGWEPVSLTEAAQIDPLFKDLASPEMFFHWHGETFDLPQGAEWLAYSKKCRHQAYRYGERVYGIQFHPEVSPEMIADWCAQPVNCGDVGTLTAPIDPFEYDQRAASQKILEAWLKI